MLTGAADKADYATRLLCMHTECAAAWRLMACLHLVAVNPQCRHLLGGGII